MGIFTEGSEEIAKLYILCNIIIIFGFEKELFKKVNVQPYDFKTFDV